MNTYQFIPIKIVLLFILVVLISTSCTPMGIGMHKEMVELIIPISSEKVQSVNVGQIIDEMNEEALLSLSSQNLDIGSIAVWRIKSYTAGLNVEMIGRNLIKQLVDLDRFKVISRDRLEEILGEQSLSLSGANDEESAVKTGQLIGVKGFLMVMHLLRTIDLF